MPAIHTINRGLHEESQNEKQENNGQGFIAFNGGMSLRELFGKR